VPGRPASGRTALHRLHREHQSFLKSMKIEIAGVHVGFSSCVCVCVGVCVGVCVCVCVCVSVCVVCEVLVCLPSGGFRVTENTTLWIPWGFPLDFLCIPCLLLVNILGVPFGLLKDSLMIPCGFPLDFLGIHQGVPWGSLVDFLGFPKISYDVLHVF
jgi:hypothetical protein